MECYQHAPRNQFTDKIRRIIDKVFYNRDITVATIDPKKKRKIMKAK